MGIFQYIYEWWYYLPEIEEEKTMEKIEVENKKKDVLEDVKIFNKDTLKKHIEENKIKKKIWRRKKRKRK